MYRLFVAIYFPEEVQGHIADICFGVPHAKWTPKDQTHLTLRFIGEVDDARCADIAESLSDVNVSRFTITLRGTGHFPPRSRPTVLWVGIEKNESLLHSKSAIEDALATTGISPEERKFAAHITVARLGNFDPCEKVGAFLSSTGLFKVPDVPVSEFYLYSSILTPSGARHRKEASYPLL